MKPEITIGMQQAVRAAVRAMDGKRDAASFLESLEPCLRARGIEPGPASLAAMHEHAHERFGVAMGPTMRTTVLGKGQAEPSTGIRARLLDKSAKSHG